MHRLRAAQVDAMPSAARSRYEAQEPNPEVPCSGEHGVFECTHVRSGGWWPL